MPVLAAVPAGKANKWHDLAHKQREAGSGC